MKRSSHVFLGSLILAKVGLVVLLLCHHGGHLFFFQKLAMAFEKEQSQGVPLQNDGGTGRSEPSELKAVLRVKAEINKEKDTLRREREELQAIQEEIAKKLAELSEVRNEIKAQMEIKKTAEEQRMKHLVKAYSAMKPQVAASLIEKLELAFAVEMLSRMPGDTVGSILSFVDKERAARICQGLVGPR